jgi:hypothetical protein
MRRSYIFYQNQKLFISINFSNIDMLNMICNIPIMLKFIQIYKPVIIKHIINAKIIINK